VHPGWARKLLSSGQAAVLRRSPFTLILKKRSQDQQVQPLRLKLDPGSRTTGLAVLNDASGHVLFAAELSHRGQQIKEGLDARRGVRSSRRNRHTRYRPPRWRNRRRRKGWLPPSLESRIANVITWVQRLRKLCPVEAISLELVKFDLQHIEQPEIQGAEYQQGTLFGYELREYLLLKWNRQCAYCGKKEVPLQVEHIQPKVKGGTDRVSNLCLACEPCNQKKGTQEIAVFLKKKPDVLAKLLAQAKAPLKDATAVNATRWALFERLKQFGLLVECGSGGLTKFNRTRLGLPKTHWLDAACVGRSTPARLQVEGVVPLLIAASGHGNRQMCGVEKHGFPIRHRQRQKVHYGYQTGDLVRAVVPAKLKCAGTHVGRVLARARGSFDIRTSQGRITDVPHRYCCPLHRNDGYSYITPKGQGGTDAAAGSDPTTQPA
ncbi:MAG: HNH endonuclease, partial [Chloroflexi bacterium]|nr:HNH endonuclease [Chloroflexota bacterium]